MAGDERPTKRQKVGDHGDNAWKGKGKRKASGPNTIDHVQPCSHAVASAFKFTCELDTEPVTFQAELVDQRSSTD